KTPDPQGLIAFLQWERDNVEEQLWGCHISNQRLQVEVDITNAVLSKLRKQLEANNADATLHNYVCQLQMLLKTNSQLEAENLQLSDFNLKEREVVMLQEANLHMNLQIQKLSEQPAVTEGLASAQFHLKKLPTMQMELKSLRVKFKRVYAITQKLKASEATQSSTITSLEDDIKSTKLSLARVAQALSVEASKANILHAIQSLKEPQQNLQKGVGLSASAEVDASQQWVLKKWLRPAQPSPLAQAGGDAQEDINYGSEGDLVHPSFNMPSPIIVNQDSNT
ncbi:hypothetical protein L0F63_007118, partial [Massospora cicadina]